MFALQRRPWIRRLLAAVSLWLVLVLAGRGHAMLALGLPLACEHLVAVDGGSSGGDRSEQHKSTDDDGCPSNCLDCACGQMPMQAAELALPLPYVLMEPHLLDNLAPPALRGRAPPFGIDRPPRFARG